MANELPSWFKPTTELVEEEKDKAEERLAPELPSWFTPAGQDVPEEAPVVVEESRPQTLRQRRRQGKTTEADLDQPTKQKIYEADLVASDYHFNEIVAPYMRARFGNQAVDGKDRADVVEKYMNNWRGWSGANSINFASEMAWYAKASDEQRAAAGQTYKFIEEDMGDLFDEGGSFMDKADIVWDYGRKAIADPLNVIGFGVGKVIGFGATKSATKIAQKVAVAEFNKQMAKGTAREASEKLAEKTFQESIQKVAENRAAKIAQSVGNRGNLIGNVASGFAIDSAAQMYMNDQFQKVLIDAGARDGYSDLEFWLSGAGGVVGAGINLGSAAAKGSTNAKLITELSRDIDSSGVGDALADTVEIMSKSGSKWADKVKAGKRLDELDMETWMALMDGTEDFVGLRGIFEAKGVKYFKGDDFETKTDWIGEVLRKVPEDEGAEFIDVFKKTTGITEAADGKPLTMDTFAEVLSAKASQLGEGLQIIRSVGQTVHKNMEDITAEDYAKAMGILKVERPTKTGLGKGSQFMKSFIDIQSTGIRGLVSNLSTTALNVKGWQLSTMINSSEDLLNVAGLAVSGHTDQAKQLLKLQGRKFMNLVDNQWTFEQYEAYKLARPKVAAMLDREVTGGVESHLDLDLNRSLFQRGVLDPAINVVQDINMVAAVDRFTKSQEFMYQIDKQVRMAYGQSFAEFTQRADAFQKMETDVFKALEMKAVDEVERAVFTRSFNDAGKMGKIAGAIEDARNVPVIGALVPFGKFFNNTVSAMSDHSGLTLMMKSFGKETDRSTGELFRRSAIGLGLSYSLVDSQIEAIKEGRGMYEIVDDTGEVTTKAYDFPITPALALSRAMAYAKLDEVMPASEYREIAETLGIEALTRTMGRATTGTQELIAEVSEDANANFVDVLGIGAGIVEGVAVTGLQSFTRTLDPVNQAFGLAAGEDFVNIDRKQGSNIILNGLRYADQIAAAIKGEPLAEEKFYAATGTMDPDLAKFGGTRRVKLTSTRRMFTMGGIRGWQKDSRTGAHAADNYYNQLYFEFMEPKAEALLNDKKFTDPKLGEGVSIEEVRKAQIDKLHKEVSAMTKDAMAFGLLANGRENMALQLDVFAPAKKKHTEKAMKFYEETKGYPDDISEYSLEQLLEVQTYVNAHKDYIEKIVNQ
jgi:hypothetical protein